MRLSPRLPDLAVSLNVDYEVSGRKGTDKGYLPESVQGMLLQALVVHFAIRGATNGGDNDNVSRCFVRSETSFHVPR